MANDEYPDELEPWMDQQMRLSPEFRRAYYEFVYSEPLPLRNGHEYHRRRRNRR